MKPSALVFVERNAYRLRRAQDGARFMVWIGVLAFLVPLAGHFSTRSGAIFLFLCWIALIALAFSLSQILRRMENKQDQRESS